MGKGEAQINFSMHAGRRGNRMGGSGSSVQLQQGMLHLELLLEKFCKCSCGVYGVSRDQSKPQSTCSEFIEPCGTLKCALGCRIRA